MRSSPSCSTWRHLSTSTTAGACGALPTGTPSSPGVLSPSTWWTALPSELCGMFLLCTSQDSKMPLCTSSLSTIITAGTLLSLADGTPSSPGVLSPSTWSTAPPSELPSACTKRGWNAPQCTKSLCKSTNAGACGALRTGTPSSPDVLSPSTGWTALRSECVLHNVSSLAQCSEHIYYCWRLWSLANRDSLNSWRDEPFNTVDGAAI